MLHPVVSDSTTWTIIIIVIIIMAAITGKPNAE
jgi:hypothetical protein